MLAQASKQTKKAVLRQPFLFLKIVFIPVGGFPLS